MVFQFAREFDDQNGVLRRQPDQHEQRDLREDVVVAAGQLDADQRAQDRHRHDQDHRQRQRPAFVLRGEHQEHQQHAQREHVDHRIAGQDVLVSQFGPFEADAFRQHFAGDLFQRGLGLAGRHAGGRAAVDVGRDVGVVALHAVRAITVFHPHQRRQRDHLALVVADLQLGDVFRLGAERRICLHAHLVGPAKLVKVIYIQRTEVDLQCLVNRRQRHAELFGLGAVDVGEQLRHVDLEARENAGQVLVRPRLPLQRLHRFVHLVVADVGAVLDHHLEAARGAEAIDRRRREHHDEGILHCA